MPRFRALFDRFAGAARHWEFVMKLGIEVGSECQDDVEYMWFEVHGFGTAEVDATLQSQPYYVPFMARGVRAWHPLDTLADWLIATPLGTFGPDTIGELERLLDQNDPRYATRPSRGASRRCVKCEV
jgi:hypothetical protein